MVDGHSEELRKDLVKIEVKLIKSEIRFLNFEHLNPMGEIRQKLT